MPDPKSDGAKPVQTPERTREILDGLAAALAERRDKFAIAFGSALLTRKDRTALALAREVVLFTNAFLAELDKKGN